jgi:prophage regulatory protein
MLLDPNPARSGVRVLRRQQILELFRISNATLYNWMQAGRFPRPVALGANTKVWLESEVDDVLQARARERDAAALPLIRTR